MPPTTHSGAAKVTLPTDEQILIAREFDAPRHLVYKAYTTPELIRRWWSGKRGAVTVAEIDLRVGGRYRYALVTDDGREVAFNGDETDLFAADARGKGVYLDVSGLHGDFAGRVPVGTFGRVRNVYFNTFLTQ